MTLFRRRRSLLAIAGTIILGLGSRRYPSLLPAVLGKYPGDALWALMVYFGWGLLFPAASIRRLAALALACSVAIELAKLSPAPWLVELRHTTFGRLVLGQVFSWQNLVAYAVGILSGAFLESRLLPHPPAAAGSRAPSGGPRPGRSAPPPHG